MIISWQGKENFLIRTKNRLIKIGEEIALGDLKIVTPGEYESGGIQVEVFDSFVEVCSEKITVAWVKKAKVLNDQDLERLNGINVLLIGVGGGEFTETKTALEVIRQIDPQVIIPMYSQNPPADRAGLDEFLKEQEATPGAIDQFKFNLVDLPTEEIKIVVLNAT